MKKDKENLTLDKSNDFKIGCHLSSSKGFCNMAKVMESIGANTFQYFSRNPRDSKQKSLDLKDIEKFLEIKKNLGIGKILTHAPYTLNPCSDKESVREFAKMVLDEDIDRLEILGDGLYNFHPGSHVGQGEEVGIEIISETLNRIMEKCQNTTVLLECMSGKGTEIGRSFEEIRMIIERVSNNDKLGVCLDTCHVHDGGYDIVNNVDGVIKAFDEIIGIKRLHAIHLNDSKNIIGSHKDRHEKIGEGHIGLDTFKKIINHKDLRNLPFYLETPNELDGYKREIELLKSLRE